MRWPHRRWAVTQYYYGIADGVVRRTWTKRTANRDAAKRNARVELLPAEYLRKGYEFRVGKREIW